MNRMKVLNVIMGVFFLLSIASYSQAGWWTPASDAEIVQVRIEAESSLLYLKVAWNSGAAEGWKRTAGSLTSTQFNQVLATALTCQANGNTVAIQTNASGYVIGILAK